MSKRLSDTEVWKKAWFFDLPDKFKLFWFYILSDCDAAGIWTVNWKLAEAYLGKLDPDKILSSLKKQVMVLNDGSYWLIIDFIRFQYGYPIRENAPMYKKLSQLLEQRKLSLDTVYDTVSNTVYNTVKEEDKDIDKDKEKNVLDTSFDIFWEAYPRKTGRTYASECWKRKKKKRPPIDQILAKLEEQKKSDQWQKDGGRFIPLPSTYINQGRWFDEVGVNIQTVKRMVV